MRGFCWRVGRVALLAAMIAVVAAGTASASFKPYSVVMTAGVGTSGSTVSAVITNETKTQQLGSVNMTVPSGYTVVGASLLSGSPGTVDWTSMPGVVELRSLALQPGQSLTVRMNVTTPTGCSTGAWNVEAKQSNDFSGTPGNDLTLDAANSNVATTLCAAPCDTNASCSTNASNSAGGAEVVANAASTSGQLLEAANSSKVAPLVCKGYTSADPNTYDVFSTAHRSKVVAITIKDPAIPLSGNANQILKTQQICFDAPYPFTTASGAPADPDGAGGFIGLLPNCTGKTPVCHNRQQDTTVADPASPLGFDIVLVADIASGLQQDPRMG